MTATYAGRSIAAARPSLPVRLLDKYFYFSMSLLIAAIVVYGFSHTIGTNLLHPLVARPTLLWFHGGVFSMGGVLHIPVGAGEDAERAVASSDGLVRSCARGRDTGSRDLRRDHHGALQHAPFASCRCGDVHAGAIQRYLLLHPDVLARHYWRREREFHRRLVLMATCALTAAAFGRFPQNVLPGIVFYLGVDVLILLGVARDLIVDRRVHPVYAWGLPALVVCQFAAMYLILTVPAWWQRIAQAIVG